MRGRLFIILAVIFAAGAAVSAYMYLDSLKQAYRESGGYVTVITAGQNIPAKTSVVTTMLKYKEIPEKFVHPDASRSAQDVIGKITLSDIAAGEQILKSKLASGEGTGTGLAYRVKPGERALTVKVDELSSLSGMLLPGDHVDILVTLSPESGAATKSSVITATMLSDIPVMATGQVLESSKDGKTVTGYQTATLAVTPVQAQLLVLAYQRGNVQLSLRSPVDKGVTKLPPTATPDIYSGTATAQNSATNNEAKTPVNPAQGTAKKSR
ncbi:MAG: Flp pilus assembly protein CpaB [Bacillota bacterium]